MRTWLTAAACAALITGCNEQPAPSSTPAPNEAPEASEAPPAPLPASDQAPSGAADQNRLEADVRFLSDDLMEGREAGTRGYDLAANFVAERFRALGLTPGGGDGTYMQQVPMVEYGKVPDYGGTLTFTGDGAPQLSVGDDYIVYASDQNARGVIEAPLVFAGYGLVADEHGRDDYEGLDVEGKVVAYLTGAPKFLNSEERAHYSSTRAKRASERGAIGTITLFTPTLQERVPYTRIQETTVGDTSMHWLDESGTPFSISPNVEGGALLSLDAAEALFANQQTQWAEIAAAEAEDAGDVKGFETTLTVRIEYESFQRYLESANVVGILPGSDPALRGEYIVVTGHLDHEGVKPTEDPGDDEIFNGAMDNATGIAAILETARLLAQNPPRRSVIFVALTAEEKGLVGSDYYARNPTVPAEQIVANINMDMPVLNYDFVDVVAFGGERSTMYPVVEAAAARADLPLSPDPFPSEGFFTRSDQYSFVKQGFPALYLDLGIAGDGEERQNEFLREHYHRASDEADLVNYDALRRFAQVNYEIVRGVADMDERPLWKKGDFFAETFNGPMEE